MKFRPLHDRVVVRRLDAEEKTAGGIIIPDTAKEKPMEGEVIAVGPGARNEQGQLVALDVKAGDRILFGKWSGTEVKLDGEELLIMKESDIMGIIEGTPPPRRRPPDCRCARSHQTDSTTRTKEDTHGCQGRSLRRRCPRAHAARRRHPRRRGEGHARPEGPQRGARQELRRAAHHQGRRDRRQGNRAGRQVREHGRADGARSRLARPTTSPATAPPPRPCWPRRSCARAPRRSPPA